MAISERDMRHLGRARRSRKLIVRLILLMWLLGAGLWVFKFSVLADAGRQHGIAGYSQLLSAAVTILLLAYIPTLRLANSLAKQVEEASAKRRPDDVAQLQRTELL